MLLRADEIRLSVKLLPGPFLGESCDTAAFPLPSDTSDTQALDPIH
jgi:hypothetical protein